MSSQISSNIFDTNIEEIHSFDAYYKNVILRNNNLIIPYINLGVSQHPANLSEELLFFDFAYMVFENVTFLDVYLMQKRLKVIESANANELHHFGGTYMDFGEGVFNDMGISCSKGYLQILQTTRLSSEMWVPKPLPDFKMNIDMQIVESFFENKYMPQNIAELIK